MTTDARGLRLTGSAAAVAGYDQAIDDLIRFRPEVVDASAAAVAADPGCAMAAVFAAYLALMSTEEGAVAAARAALDGLRADPARPAAPGTGAPGRRHPLGGRGHDRGWRGPGRDLGQLPDRPAGPVHRAPDRLLHRQRGQPAGPDRPGPGRLAGGHPQLGFVHGMYAFGLEECNLYQQSEEAGQRAVEQNPDDVWGIHAVVHTYEMAGRIPDGVRYLRRREADWTAGNFLNVHNSWHYALYLLQGGDTDGALAVYDRMLHHEGSATWRWNCSTPPRCCGGCTSRAPRWGDRWPPLAAAWGRLLAPGYYPFNDMHAVMAFIGNGELDRAGQVVAAQAEVAAHGDPGSTGWAMTAQVGLPVCRALLHFGHGRVRPRARTSCCRSGPRCTRSAAVTRSATRWSARCSKRPSGPGGWSWPPPWSASGCRSASATPTPGRSGPGCAGPRATSRARRPRRPGPARWPGRSARRWPTPSR